MRLLGAGQEMRVGLSRNQLMLLHDVQTRTHALRFAQSSPTRVMAAVLSCAEPHLKSLPPQWEHVTRMPATLKCRVSSPAYARLNSSMKPTPRPFSLECA